MAVLALVAVACGTDTGDVTPETVVVTQIVEVEGSVKG